ncbi:hypothetical protein KQX54_010068 [Cotesia glomerata]|uniref:Uncharacterized protein n=1 Tax=Cotesia glomerata TaxID=32391 RepID=A0AAV7J552_COTGL|nr:hypothetical protein KQX54_010068 [Cotesia glomerata]
MTEEDSEYYLAWYGAEQDGYWCTEDEVMDVLAAGKNRYSRLLTRLLCCVQRTEIFTLYSFPFHLAVLLRTSKSLVICVYLFYRQQTIHHVLRVEGAERSTKESKGTGKDVFPAGPYSG